MERKLKIARRIVPPTLFTEFQMLKPPFSVLSYINGFDKLRKFKYISF